MAERAAVSEGVSATSEPLRKTPSFSPLYRAAFPRILRSRVSGSMAQEAALSERASAACGSEPPAPTLSPLLPPPYLPTPLTSERSAAVDRNVHQPGGGSRGGGRCSSKSSCLANTTNWV